MPEPSVLIVIVNWNLKKDTVACIESVGQTGHPCQIVVVDNGSQDDSAEHIARRFPHVKVMGIPRNIGFAAACNLAIKDGLDEHTQYVLLLNNDTVLHPDFFTELLRAAKANPQAGIFGPKVYSAAEPDRLWHAGARRRRWVLAAVDLGRDQCDNGQFEHVREVDYVFGCSMLIRRQVFERVGMLDTGYFLYLEDMDFCLRAQAAGYRLLFVPQARVWHQGSASTAQNPSLRKYHLVKSTLYFLRKHAAKVWFPAAVVFWALVFLRAVIVEFLRGDLDSVRAYSRGLFQGWSQT
jgi:GT2 family glycosyltransferase